MGTRDRQLLLPTLQGMLPVMAVHQLLVQQQVLVLLITTTTTPQPQLQRQQRQPK